MTENITCPKCRYRHPAGMTCSFAAQRAAEAREKREEFAKQYPVLTKEQELQQTLERLTRQVDALMLKVFNGKAP